jgi:hypothetical protein
MICDSRGAPERSDQTITIEDYMTPIIADANQSQSREFRTVTASTKVTELELGELERAAALRGVRLGEWVRDVLLREARSPSEAISLRHVMTEIVGLQLFLTNALTPVLCGQRIIAKQYEELLQNVKANKRRAAREVIAQYVAERKEDDHA